MLKKVATFIEELKDYRDNLNRLLTGPKKVVAKNAQHVISLFLETYDQFSELTVQELKQKIEDQIEKLRQIERDATEQGEDIDQEMDYAEKKLKCYLKLVKKGPKEFFDL